VLKITENSQYKWLLVSSNYYFNLGYKYCLSFYSDQSGLSYCSPAVNQRTPHGSTSGISEDPTVKAKQDKNIYTQGSALQDWEGEREDGRCLTGCASAGAWPRWDVKKDGQDGEKTLCEPAAAEQTTRGRRAPPPQSPAAAPSLDHTRDAVQGARITEAS
jgi:hypothetical protein